MGEKNHTTHLVAPKSEAMDRLRAPASRLRERRRRVEVIPAEIQVLASAPGEIEMLVVTNAAVRDSDGLVVETAGVAVVVLDVVPPGAATGTAVLGEHADADVGVLALGEARGGQSRSGDLGTHPDGCVGVGGEVVAAFEGDGVSGDGPGDVDATGGSEGLDADFGRDRSGEGAGGEEDGGDEEFGKHFEGWKLGVCVDGGICGGVVPRSWGRGAILYK